MSDEWRWWRYDHANTGCTPHAGPTGDVSCRWTYDAGYFVTGTPVIADAVVHAATQFPHDAKSNLHGIDVESGTKRYSVPKDDPQVELRGSPTVLDGTAYVTMLDFPPLVRGYDVDTGERVREYDGSAPLSTEGVPPLAEGGMLYCLTDWTLSAVEIETGVVHWSFAPRESFYGAAALVGDTLYVGSSGLGDDELRTGDDDAKYARKQSPRLRALDARTGDIEWERALDIVPRTVAVADRRVFCCGPEPYSRYSVIESPVGLSDGGLPKYGGVHAFSSTGELLWTVELDAQIRSAPSVADGTVLVGTRDGEGTDAATLFALDAETGARIWSREGDRHWTAASVANGVVYAGNTGGYVEAQSLEDGSVLWRFETEGGVYGPPSIAGGRLFVGDADGTVYALEEA
ncbi:PQQ-binding-like beta-propeller repeat protein [Haloferax sp. DFSO60]|uniref:outer membrane protein assembly factor BamB family protein n=1 Tax=Haloferax sp. DFSO60 TaxID=3388652 RepID=UPI00397D3A2B